MLVGAYHIWFGCVATAAIMRFSAAKKILHFPKQNFLGLRIRKRLG
jgi:hypothetical protein